VVLLMDPYLSVLSMNVAIQMFPMAHNYFTAILSIQNAISNMKLNFNTTFIASVNIIKGLMTIPLRG
jgi:hypothetical protein